MCACNSWCSKQIVRNLELHFSVTLLWRFISLMILLALSYSMVCFTVYLLCLLLTRKTVHIWWWMVFSPSDSTAAGSSAKCSWPHSIICRRGHHCKIATLSVLEQLERLDQDWNAWRVLVHGLCSNRVKSNNNADETLWPSYCRRGHHNKIRV